jgi:ribulose-5-phosphate 4-epimerase/fuculose-1-phosphate aldolase
MVPVTDRLREQVTDACAVLVAFGIVGAFGHVSARVPGTTNLLITPRMPLSLVDAASLVTYDLASGATDGDQPLEVHMHSAIYAARPDVNAICRIHAPYVAALAAAATPLPAVHGFGTNLGPLVPVHPELRLITDPALGASLAATLSHGDAVLVRANGAVTVGESVAAATARALILEESARTWMLARAAGLDPLHMTPDEVAGRRSDDAGRELERLWQFAVAKARSSSGRAR